MVEVRCTDAVYDYGLYDEWKTYVYSIGGMVQGFSHPECLRRRCLGSNRSKEGSGCLAMSVRCASAITQRRSRPDQEYNSQLKHKHLYSEPEAFPDVPS